MSEEQNSGRWVKSSSCVHRKHANLYILRVAIWKTSRGRVCGKGKRGRFDHRCPEPFQSALQMDVSVGREVVNINKEAVQVHDSARSIM